MLSQYLKPQTKKYTRNFFVYVSNIIIDDRKHIHTNDLERDHAEVKSVKTLIPTAALLSILVKINSKERVSAVFSFA